MDWWIVLFGEGKELNVLQMSMRALVVFIAALIMLRITGQRTFGKKSALDNVVVIVLGAMLSRAITGSSPFWPVMAGSFVIVLFHRFLCWLALYNQKLDKIINGERISLFKNGQKLEKNMRKTMITHKDVMEGIRIQVNADATDKVSEVFIERSGEISVIKKE